VDIVSKEKRASMMGAVRQKNTRPEVIVRQELHRSGLRFRLHRCDLPGTPDIVLPARRVVIFVHGCFWHRHSGCKKSTTPKSRESFWTTKFIANIQRDRKVRRKLRAEGWSVVTIWECQTKDRVRLTQILKRRLPFIPKPLESR
jgi:DNA mismatch endonuclease (patch repair protein)